MKPFRGKRRGPQSPPVGFNLPARRRGASIASARSAAGRYRCGRRVHFRAGGAPRPVRRRSEASRGRWPAPQGVRCYRPVRRWPVGGPRKTAARSVSGVARSSGVRSNCGDCSSVPANCGRSAIGVLRSRLGVGGESVGHLSDPS